MKITFSRIIIEVAQNLAIKRLYTFEIVYCQRHHHEKKIRDIEDYEVFSGKSNNWNREWCEVSR